MKDLYNDQMNDEGWQLCSNYIWCDDLNLHTKSGVWEYYKTTSEKLSVPLVDSKNITLSGVLFVGMCHIIEDIFDKLPKGGNYIVIHRGSDRPFTEEIFKRKPDCVKHIFTADCRVKDDCVSAFPYGMASIEGIDHWAIQVAQEDVPKQEKPIFCRYNINPATLHRNESMQYMRNNPLVDLIEEQIPRIEFTRHIKAHKFTMALHGMSADANRQWTAITLGSIPIVTDCIEMRFFEDLPLAYCPKDFNDITTDWLDNIDVSKKSTERMRMSYWANQVNQKKIEHGIE